MPESKADSAAINVNDELIERLADLTVLEAAPKKKNMLPAEFFAMQSARSTLLARKTKTAKLSRKQNSLVDDLLSHSASNEKSVSKKAEEVSEDAASVDEHPNSEDEEKGANDFLLVRGAVTRKKSQTADHPFVKKTIAKKLVSIAATKEVIEYASYSATGGGYECGTNEWQDLHSAPSDGRSSAIARVGASMTGFMLTPDASPEGPRSSTEESPESSNSSSKMDDEIPDTLVDFIMEYTRMAITPQPPRYFQPVLTPAASVPPQVDSFPPQFKPHEVQELIEAGLISLGLCPAALSFVTPAHRPAAARLRAHIGEAKVEASKSILIDCVHNCGDVLEKAGAKSETELLFWRDSNGISLLHRALMGNSRELAQAYVIIEQQLLQPRECYMYGLPWDLRNKFGESPLWWAVCTMKPLMVDYLLELGADPNVRTARDKEDSVLHHAARRGMTAIVKSLIDDSRCNVEARNKPGETPLLTAVFYNNAIQQTSGLRMDTVEVAEALLKAGADPTVVDKSGNNLFHIAASACDTPMLELFAKLIPDEVSTPLANAKNNKGARPLEYLRHHEGEIDDGRYRRCFFALLTCNAKVDSSEEGSEEEENA